MSASDRCELQSLGFPLPELVRSQCLDVPEKPVPESPSSYAIQPAACTYLQTYLAYKTLSLSLYIYITYHVYAVC